MVEALARIIQPRIEFNSGSDLGVYIYPDFPRSTHWNPDLASKSPSKHLQPAMVQNSGQVVMVSNFPNDFVGPQNRDQVVMVSNPKPWLTSHQFRKAQWFQGLGRMMQGVKKWVGGARPLWSCLCLCRPPHALSSISHDAVRYFNPWQ